ncbi:cytochrome P450 [Ceratobasidium sp. AG-I]|nr:cytochrome P450 [Ceratobasidium sp. AG-I]
MTLLKSSSDLSQLWFLLVLAVELVRDNPGKSLGILLGAVIIKAVITRLLISYHYRNIAGPPSSHFLYGNLKDIYSPQGLRFHDSLQDNYGSVSKVGGLFGSERLYISDPRALHEILVKENDTAFRHPQFNYDYVNLSFGPGLLGTTGATHRMQRKMLNPVFTAKHMKARDLDMLYWCGAAALELIGQAGKPKESFGLRIVLRLASLLGIGHKFRILQGVHSAYSNAVKSFLPMTLELTPYRIVLPLVYNLRPGALRRKIVEWTPSAKIQKLKDIIDIQDRQAQMILSERRTALREGKPGEGPADIMSILLKASMEASESDRLPEDQLLGQMNTFIFAGHETTGGALARILHLLSINQDIQDRLRAELQAAPVTFDYNELNSLEYLDAICREALRLYPPGPIMERQALKDWVVPLRYPIKGNDGKELWEIKVRKGTNIHVGLREANRCKETWGPDADEFNPDRWLGNLPNSVFEAKTSGVYSSMMTFSAGPRACLGFKFSILEIKTVLSVLLKTFKFAPSGTPIEWCFGFAMSPFEVKADNKYDDPSMPLHVSLI